MWKIALVMLAMISASAAKAETYKKTYSSGSWVLYRVDGMQVHAPDGKWLAIDGICLAAFTSKDASLKFAMAPAAVARRRPYLRNYVWVQIASGKWNFRKRKASVALAVKVADYTEPRAQYDGFAITFGVPNMKNFRLFLTFAGGSKTIDVLDSRRAVIAKFPAYGFAKVRDKLFSCAGV